MIMWVTKTGIFASPRNRYTYVNRKNDGPVITPDDAGLAASLAIGGTMLLGIALMVALGNGC